MVYVAGADASSVEGETETLVTELPKPSELVVTAVALPGEMVM